MLLASLWQEKIRKLTDVQNTDVTEGEPADPTFHSSLIVVEVNCSISRFFYSFFFGGDEG